jgi:hydrogenase maturation protease
LKNKILVLGVGNMLMGDEAVGIHIVKSLNANELPQNVDVVDGGTGGFHLLSYLSDYKKIIFVDASLDDRPEGTVTVIEPKFSTDFPKSLSAHDIGLKDLIESAALLGELPKMFLVIISIKKFQDLSLELSPQISKAIPQAVETIKSLINKMNKVN